MRGSFCAEASAWPTSTSGDASGSSTAAACTSPRYWFTWVSTSVAAIDWKLNTVSRRGPSPPSRAAAR